MGGAKCQQQARRVGTWLRTVLPAYARGLGSAGKSAVLCLARKVLAILPEAQKEALESLPALSAEVGECLWAGYVNNALRGPNVHKTLGEFINTVSFDNGATCLLVC